MKFWIDIETAAGVKVGGGPIVSATEIEVTARLDQAGQFRFTMPATDPKAANVQAKLRARA